LLSSSQFIANVFLKIYVLFFSVQWLGFIREWSEWGRIRKEKTFVTTAIRSRCL